jgi:hypothetical protein
VDNIKLLGFLLGFFVFTAYAGAGEKYEIINGSPRCDLNKGAGHFYIPIRGTGYFWLEYVPRGFSNGNQLLILIKSNVPIFKDKTSNGANENTCSDQTIVTHKWIELSPNQVIDSFDCHIADDMPLPVGEVVVGMIDGDRKEGLYRATRSWKIFIKPHGIGGEISELSRNSRVYCTILPSIDG